MINHSNTHSTKRSSARRKPHHLPFGRQTGGTLLGVIIGLIVGLGIALAVAVTITKTSLPFLNKQGKSEKAGELTPGQASDPNRPLYGSKEAAREAAKGFVKEAEPAAPPATDTKPAPADKPADIKPTEIKPAAKPAESKEAAAAKTDNADDKWSYFLQAGAFREQADAESTRAKLALAGFESSISERPSESGGPLYRVRLGPFHQLEAMNRVRSKLSDNGIDVAVVRIAK
jgi:cell division protein FtsN